MSTEKLHNVSRGASTKTEHLCTFKQAAANVANSVGYFEMPKSVAVVALLKPPPMPSLMRRECEFHRTTVHKSLSLRGDSISKSAFWLDLGPSTLTHLSN